MRRIRIARPNISSRKSSKVNSERVTGWRPVLEFVGLIVAIVAITLVTAGTSEASENSPPVLGASCSSDGTGFVNPCATLDITQVEFASVSTRLDDPAPELGEWCGTELDETTPAVWAQLLELGYVGDPTDGVEALYAPCHLIGALHIIESGINR